eukprot:1330732-Amorphochlora_amoeboformis.AAC.1
MGVVGLIEWAVGVGAWAGWWDEGECDKKQSTEIDMPGSRMPLASIPDACVYRMFSILGRISSAFPPYSPSFSFSIHLSIVCQSLSLSLFLLLARKCLHFLSRTLELSNSRTLANLCMKGLGIFLTHRDTCVYAQVKKVLGTFEGVRNGYVSFGGGIDA